MFHTKLREKKNSKLSHIFEPTCAHAHLTNQSDVFIQVNKQNEQMYTLLAMCLVLHPMRIDESVHSQLREKYGDRMLRMQKG